MNAERLHQLGMVDLFSGLDPWNWVRSTDMSG